jgi:hypothetical protein
MDRSKEIALLAEGLELVRRKQLPMAGDEARVPVSDYLSADRFEAERALFHRSMNIVAHGSQILSPGDFITRNVNHTFTKKTLDEDWKIAEQIQRGMHAGANEFFRFAKFEGALAQWHRRLNEKLGR